jgi:hypothetical protein
MLGRGGERAERGEKCDVIRGTPPLTSRVAKGLRCGLVRCDACGEAVILVLSFIPSFGCLFYFI